MYFFRATKEKNENKVCIAYLEDRKKCLHFLLKTRNEFEGKFVKYGEPFSNGVILSFYKERFFGLNRNGIYQIFDYGDDDGDDGGDDF